MIALRLFVALGAVMLTVVAVLDTAEGDLLAGSHWMASAAAAGFVSVSEPWRDDRLGATDAAMAFILVACLLRLAGGSCIWCS